LRTWLKHRQHARATHLLGTALARAVGPKHEKADPGRGMEETNPDQITLGQSMETGTSVQIELEALRRHTVIFAGSGSGKTVFIPRLVDEFPLRAASSIALDPNSDLAGLGLDWPAPPPGWGPGD